MLLSRWRHEGYLQLVAGMLPVLVLGFTASALANRLDFLAWALGVAVGFGALLRRGWQAAWRGPFLLASALTFLAVGYGLFATLVGRHHDLLDAAWALFLPRIYSPIWTRQETYYALAATLLVFAVTVAVVTILRSRS